MKNPVSILLCFSVPVIFLQSCYHGPVIYGTTVQNVPMFQEKGEFAGSLGYAAAVGDGGREAVGFSGQAAYALSNHWAGLVSVYTMANEMKTEPYDWKSNTCYYELGGGRFGVLKNGKFAWEMYGGLGFYSLKNQAASAYCNVQVLKPFLQPSIGYVGRYFDIVLTPRVGYATYSSKDYSRGSSGITLLPPDMLSNCNNKFVFEPGLTVRGGANGIKLQLQYNISTIQHEYGGYYKMHASLGLYYMLSKRYQGKKY